jgi:hypothetical protein
MILVANISAILQGPEALGLSIYSQLIFVFQCHEPPFLLTIDKASNTLRFVDSRGGI